MHRIHRIHHTPACPPACPPLARFRELKGEIKGELGNLNKGKKELFEGVPGMMMITMIPNSKMGKEAGELSWNTHALEDHAATACAVQNFMLCLASEGMGSKWMTGAMGIGGDDMLELVNAAPEEHYMGGASGLSGPLCVCVRGGRINMGGVRRALLCVLVRHLTTVSGVDLQIQRYAN